jgi:chemotaxis protein CheC
MSASEIVLDELQRDALSELFNIGVGRAAAALSQIVRKEVALSAPDVMLVPAAQVRESLLGPGAHQFSTVSQYFSGPFDAEAVLVFPETNALIIVGHMLGHQLTPDELSEYEQEAMCEVGNIILNACISVLADTFHVEFNGDLPQHHYGDGNSICFNIETSQPYVLVLKVGLTIQEESIDGHLLYLLGVRSLQSLFDCIDSYLTENGLK